MPTMWRRDLEADGVKFERWLRGRLPNARDLRMSPLVSPTSSGFSNETLLFDLAWSENGRAVQERLVVRIQPIGYQVFPEYDLGLQFRPMQPPAATPLDQEIAYYEKYYTWAARGRENPIIEAAHDWLVAHKPGPEREGLVWGDARIGNMIFDGTKPAAVLDWEMVSSGSPERDV